MEKINFANGQAPYINDTNLNQMQDNVEEEITKKGKYSTTETIIGTWINGKPIYRKVFNLGAYTFIDGDNVYPISSLNIDELVLGRLFFKHSNKHYAFHMSVPYSLQVTNQNIYFICSEAFTCQQCYIVLEYTKTTD